MEQKILYPKLKFILGLVALLIGLWAANLALFDWVKQNGFYYLLGDYARYACAYGGFAAMIFGGILINDFLVWRSSVTKKLEVSLPSKKKANRKTQKNPKKPQTVDHETIMCYLEEEKEKPTVEQKA
jgi:hypothetical protein